MKKILNDKKILMTVLSIILVLVVMSSTTYALFFKVHTMDNTESYTSGILDITVEEGTKLELVNSLPITDEEGATLTPYTFTITNVGNLAYTFDLKVMSTTSDNQINSDYIKIQLNDNEPVVLSSLNEATIAKELTLNPEDSITMSIRIWLNINTPNTEIGKKFDGKVIVEGTGIYNKSLDTLNKLGLKKNTNQNLIDFSKMATTDEGIYAAVDDLGISYYFRGAVGNNYVKFAGFYWRIIRINGDGTIRMIYDGTSAHVNGESSADRHVSTTAFNSNYNDNAYAGYMYGTPGSGTYEETHANINDSTIKTINDNWYKTNIVDKGYSKYVADAIYCNDRSILSGTGIGTVTTLYKTNGRLNDNINPSLKCSQYNDKFTISDTLGNGDLTYPIGLITLDEIVFAGGIEGGYNSNFYLFTGELFWSMSPSLFENQVIESYWFRKRLDSVSVENIAGVRPVISLKSDILFTGNGTMESPFEIAS